MLPAGPNSKRILPRGRMALIALVLAALLGAALWHVLGPRLAANDDPETLAACGPLIDRSIAAETIRLTVGGKRRRFDVHMPGDLASRSDWPVVFVFHARDGSPADITSYGPFLSPLRRQAIFVAPEGQHVYGGFGWDEACHGQDMALFDVTLACMRRRYGLGLAQVDAFGFSWGGDFVNALGCCRGPALRRVVVASGGEMGTLDGFKTDLSACKSPTPAYLSFHGTADPVYRPEIFEATIRAYRTLQTCGGGSTVAGDGCRAFDGCAKPVVQCRIQGLGHATTDRGTQRAVEFLTTGR